MTPTGPKHMSKHTVRQFHFTQRQDPDTGTRVTRPAGGYFLWLELPAVVDALKLHQQAMAAGISSAPGVLFSADRRFMHHLRLNVGHPGDPRIGPALRTLGELACAAASA